jgi:dUTP pyrophosphatase
MEKIAKFYKVSQNQFLLDMKQHFPDMTSDEIQEVYGQIQLPRRATVGSAGYDFFTPIKIDLEPDETFLVPTGIRVAIDNGWVLKCYPRSGMGFKYRMQLNNTVGIIDSDYFNSDNEGHILAKITNDSNEGKKINIPVGQGFIQGVFVEYGITHDDNVDDVRVGGFGSTTEKVV